jgi:hypothetical protein
MKSAPESIASLALLERFFADPLIFRFFPRKEFHARDAFRSSCDRRNSIEGERRLLQHFFADTFRR